MQLASAPVTQPFSILYSAYEQTSAADAGAKVAELAKQHDVELTKLDIGPAVLESLPPQGSITGELSGAAESVRQALAALELLDREV